MLYNKYVMKYLVLLGDGMADRPLSELNGLTPLEAAHKPNIDLLSREGEIGLCRTVPHKFKPGSDVANLSVMGYPPEQFYSGRSPLEALSIGVKMDDEDVAIRTNLVTISDDGIMEDYSAGEISTEEARELIAAVNLRFSNEKIKFYAGVSYRHCLIIKGASAATSLTPPHDISLKNIKDYLPSGEFGEELKDIILKSREVLLQHPVNKKRVALGKRPATNVWFWGAGVKPRLESFKERYGIKGGVISAVDLLKGIAKGADMECPDVIGATGTLETNFEGKVNAALELFTSGVDYVYLHVEAPDECGHQGDICGKIKAIEMLDKMLEMLRKGLEVYGEGYVIAVLPDHFTPISIRTHSADPVPYIIYNSEKPAHSNLNYNEKNAQKGKFLPEGSDIIRTMLGRI